MLEIETEHTLLISKKKKEYMAHKKNSQERTVLI